MFSTLAITVVEAEKLVQHAASLVDQMMVLNGEWQRSPRPDGNSDRVLEEVQQNERGFAHPYHLGNTIWNHIHDNVRERTGNDHGAITGFETSSGVVEDVCELGGLELDRWENEGGKTP